MNKKLQNQQESDIALCNRQLIPPVFYKDKIYFISNPKLFLVLYKIGKLQDFMLFADVCGYDETKKWLKHYSLLGENLLENVSLYSLTCRIKQSHRLRFYTKNPVGKVGKYDFN